MFVPQQHRRNHENPFEVAARGKSSKKRTGALVPDQFERITPDAKRLDDHDSTMDGENGGSGTLDQLASTLAKELRLVSNRRDFSDADETISRIHVMSSERDAAKFPNSTHFQVPFFNPNAQVLKSIELIGVNIPFTCYNISPNNNTLHLSEISTIAAPGDNGTTVLMRYYPCFFKLTIPPGNYSIQEMVETLNALKYSWEPVLPGAGNRSPEAGYATAYYSTASKDTVHNVYTWYYTMTPNPRIFLSYTNSAPEYYESYLHCPPRLGNFIQTTSNADGSVRRKDIGVDSISFADNGNMLVLKADTAMHNVTRLSLIRSIHLTVKSLNKKWEEYYLFSSAFTPPSGSTIYIPLTGVETTLIAKFGTEYMSQIEGYFTVEQTYNSAWNCLGFVNSSLQNYKSVELISWSTSTISPSNNYVFTTAVSIPPTWTSIVFDQDMAHTDTVAGESVNVTSVFQNTFQVTSGQIVTSSVKAHMRDSLSPWMIHSPRTFFGDQSYDLRSNTVVLMKLKVRDRYVGEYFHSISNDNQQLVLAALNQPIFAVFALDSLSYGENFQINRETDGYLGKYNFDQNSRNMPIRKFDLTGNIEIELMDSQGYPFDINNMNWSCKIEFVFTYNSRKS